MKHLEMRIEAGTALQQIFNHCHLLDHFTFRLNCALLHTAQYLSCTGTTKVLLDSEYLGKTIRQFVDFLNLSVV